MSEYKDQLEGGEREKVTKLVQELREIAAKAQSGDQSITPDQIREAINATQQASLGLFQKVYEKRQAANESKDAGPEEPKSEEKKD